MDLKTRGDRIIQLETENADAEALRTANQTIDAHEATIVTLGKEKAEVEKLLNGYQKDNAEPETRVKDAENNLRKAERTISEHERTISNLEKELETAKKRYEADERYIDSFEANQKMLEQAQKKDVTSTEQTQTADANVGTVTNDGTSS